MNVVLKSIFNFAPNILRFCSKALVLMEKSLGSQNVKCMKRKVFLRHDLYSTKGIYLSIFKKQQKLISTFLSFKKLENTAENVGKTCQYFVDPTDSCSLKWNKIQEKNGIACWFRVCTLPLDWAQIHETWTESHDSWIHDQTGWSLWFQDWRFMDLSIVQKWSSATEYFYSNS